MLRSSEDTGDAVENILRLRRAERRADEPERAEIAEAREFLERIVGPTVRPADAARLLGVTKPALSRWLRRGEISTVLTPRGRREVPLDQLVDLVEEVDAARSLGRARPLAHVVRERNRRAHESIDLERILPQRRPRTHRAPELQSLAYHRLIAERLDEETLEKARRTLLRWERSGRIDPRWATEWERLLARPIDVVAKVIGADTPRSRALRQTSPFAGVLTEQERRLLTRAVEARYR